MPDTGIIFFNASVKSQSAQIHQSQPILPKTLTRDRIYRFGTDTYNLGPPFQEDLDLLGIYMALAARL